MKEKPILFNILISVFIGFQFNVTAQTLIIKVKNDTAFFNSNRFHLIDNESIKIDRGNDTLKIDFGMDLTSYSLIISDENGKIDSILNPGDEKTIYSKPFNFLFKKKNILKLSFSNDSINFSFNNTLRKEIIIIRNSSQPGDIFNNEISFIPASIIPGESGWPNYVSEYGNSKYRMAVDLSSSFSNFSLWKYKRSKEIYKYKEILPLAYGKSLSLSIKGFYPQYDSIVTTPMVSDFNLEDRKYFENIVRSGPGFQIAEGAPLEEEKPPAAEATAAIIKAENDILKMLTKLKNDLLEYQNYLNRNIVDKTIWLNDLQYINSKLNIYLKLKDFSAGGIRLRLGQLTDSTLLINDIVSSYANIQVYSIYNSPPVQINDADLLKYEFSFYKNGHILARRDFSFLIQGGFKVDFSTGFAYSSLRNENYMVIDAGTEQDTSYFINEFFITTDSITSINTVNLKKIIKDKSDLSIGVAVLAHFYSRTGRIFNAGGSLGFMVNTNAEINYLAGLSVILGQKQRLVVSGGSAFGQVNKLNPKYDETTNYKETELDSVKDSQLTRKEWMTGYFISLTYNLGGI